MKYDSPKTPVNLLAHLQAVALKTKEIYCIILKYSN